MDALKAIRALVLQDRFRHTKIVGVEQLWQLLARYFPIDLFPSLDEAERHIGRLSDSYGLQVQIGQTGVPFMSMEVGGRKFHLTERYPGQLQKQPLTIKTVFQFPDTPEGKAKQQELETALATGSRLQVPAEYVDIEFPPALQEVTERLTGERPGRAATVEISSALSSRSVPVRLDIECDDGDSASLEYIELKALHRSGAELILSNDDQPYPIRVLVALDLDARTYRLTISQKPGPIAAPLLLKMCRAVHCMAKTSTSHLTVVGSGALVSTTRRDRPQEGVIDPTWIHIAGDLSLVQERTRQVIYIPDREFTEDEWKTIHLLGSLLRKPVVETTWRDMPITVVLDGVREVLGHFGGEQTRWMRVERDESVELFGALIPIGRVRYTVDEARLSNEGQVHDWLEREPPGEEGVEIVLVPGQNNRVTIEYLDWVQGKGAVYSVPDQPAIRAIGEGLAGGEGGAP